MVLNKVKAGEGNGHAYGEGWQQHMLDTLPESELELAAAFVCNWLFAGMIAWMKG